MSKTLDYSTPVTTIDGQTTDLQAYKGQALLVVNVASKCGFTPQYEGLEKLHQDYKDQGLTILGFPCNQFGKQEPGNEDAIKEFCSLTYGVSFPMFAKVEVNGSDAHPLFNQLKEAAPGLMGTTSVKWNFTKFLVGPDGAILKRYAPKDTPKKIGGDVAKLLADASA